MNPIIKPVVYLFGFISTEKEVSLQWRKVVEARFYQDYGRAVRVLSPMRGKADLGEESPDGGISSLKRTSKDIMLRDHQDVCRSTLLFGCLDNWGSSRPLCGTLMELGWAWEKHIPVVAWCEPDNYLMRNHPMVSETVSHMFADCQEAYDFTCRYYLL